MQINKNIISKMCAFSEKNSTSFSYMNAKQNAYSTILPIENTRQALNLWFKKQYSIQ